MKAARAEKARADGRSRAALTGDDKRAVARQIIRGLGQVAEEEMSSTGYAAGIPFVLAPHVAPANCATQ